MCADAGLRETAEVALPSGVTAKLDGRAIVVHGPLGTVRRGFPADALSMSTSAGSVTLTLRIPSNRKRAKALLHTWEAHLKNLILGVTQGFEARMKVVAAHFPMKVQAKDGELVIENFLGEKYPRSAPLVPGVRAEVSGEFVVLTGHDIEQVGQSAANIERATHIRDYDPRVFQDGIYIIEKPRPKEVAA
jgi:large subunit ribosomal protein L6